MTSLTRHGVGYEFSLWFRDQVHGGVLGPLTVGDGSSDALVSVVRSTHMNGMSLSSNHVVLQYNTGPCYCEAEPSPAVQLLHLLNGVGASQALWGRRSSGTLPCRGSVHMVHKEDPAVTVDPSLPV